MRASTYLYIAGHIIAIVGTLVILAGCATTSTIPTSLLTCADHPPSPAAETQQAVGLFIIDLAEAGADCRSKLGAVRRLLSSGD
jgi:hypothetical protein